MTKQQQKSTLSAVLSFAVCLSAFYFCAELWQAGVICLLTLIVFALGVEGPSKSTKVTEAPSEADVNASSIKLDSVSSILSDSSPLLMEQLGSVDSIVNQGADDANTVHMAKVWCGDVLARVSQAAQHVHGGMGYWGWYIHRAGTPPGSWGPTSTGTDGTFRVRGLGEGSFWLRPSAPGFVGEPTRAEAGATPPPDHPGTPTLPKEGMGSGAGWWMCTGEGWWAGPKCP